MPSEPSALARVHLAPSKCYWPRRIPAPLGVTPQSTAASQPAGDPGSSASPPCVSPGVPQQGLGGLKSCPGCRGLRAGGGVGRGWSSPARRRGCGCYMTRHGRHWAGTHRGCDSCCGYNREPGEGGRGRLRSLRPAGSWGGLGSALTTLGEAPPGSTGNSHRTEVCVPKYPGTPGSPWHPELAPRGVGAGMLCVPPAERGQRRGPGWLLASCAGSTGRGSKAGTEESS